MKRSCSRSNWHLHTLWNCTKPTLHYGALSRPFVDSVLTNVGEDLVADDPPASFTMEVQLFFCYKIIYVTRRLTIRYFWTSLSDDLVRDYWKCAGYSFKWMVAALCVLQIAISSTTSRDTAIYGRVQSCGYSRMLAFCAKWTAVVYRGRPTWGHTCHKCVDISVSWAKAHLQIQYWNGRQFDIESNFAAISAMVQTVAYVSKQWFTT